MSTIEQQVRERIARRVDAASVPTHATAQALFDGIMEDVQVALVLARREAIRHYGGIHNSHAAKWIAEAHPLPKRTRQVPREEPVPGEDFPPLAIRYRWVGHLEMRHASLWQPAEVHCSDVGLMRHALDLHDNPYRTEEYEPDENDPWPPLPDAAA